MTLSLTASQLDDSTALPIASVLPGALPDQASALEVPRGIYSFGWLALEDGSLPSLNSAILAFGDGSRGQLGMSASESAIRRMHVSVVEDLRNFDPVQVEAGGT